MNQKEILIDSSIAIEADIHFCFILQTGSHVDGASLEPLIFLSLPPKSQG